MGSLDPDSVQIIVRGLVDAQERKREEVLELVRRKRSRMRGVESKGVLTGFAVGNIVLEVRGRQPAITPKLMSTCTGPWRVISKTGGNVHGVEDIITGHSREVHIAQMRSYAGASLNVIAECHSSI